MVLTEENMLRLKLELIIDTLNGSAMRTGITILIFFVLLSGCKKKNSPVERPRPEEPLESLVIIPGGTNANQVSISTGEKFQVIDNFGASDCWSTQFVGKWPSSKTNVMADWLFSMDTTENGQPLGIGLSAWRFNIGAGSAQQGDDSGISDTWRRSQSFLQPDGNYNWDKQAGQQWFLKAAHERGVNQFIGFSNSPPVQLTRNGKAYCSTTYPENIKEDKLPEFADFLVDVVSGIKDQTGINLTYISPVNEPQWDWTSGSQEGCYLTNATYRQLVEILNQKLTVSSVPETKILVTEAGTWSYLYGEGNESGNQIDYFFGPESPVNTAPSLARIIAGHSYYTTTPESKLILTREQVRDKASSINELKTWSTEYCPLGDGDQQALGWSSWKKDLGMDVALYVAGIIYYDLCYANASAWQWWLAISPYNYPDGLIYVSKNSSNGTYNDSKLMWGLGNYSRFIRPGAQRIKATFNVEDVYVTAAINDAEKSLTVVVVNSSEKTIPMKLNLNGIENIKATPYITSGKDKHKLMPMERIDLSDGFELPPRCIITFSSTIND